MSSPHPGTLGPPWQYIAPELPVHYTTAPKQPCALYSPQSALSDVFIVVCSPSLPRPGTRDSPTERATEPARRRLRVLFCDRLSPPPRTSPHDSTHTHWFPTFEFTWLGEEMRENLPKEMDFVHEKRNAERAMADFENVRTSLYIRESVFVSCAGT